MKLRRPVISNDSLPMKLSRSQCVALPLAGIVAFGVPIALWDSPPLRSKYRCWESDATSDRVQIPSFSVSVSLSEAASRKLRSIKEDVAVHAVFDGDGAPEPGENTAPHRDVFLCYTRPLMLGDASQVEFSGLSVPQSRITRLSNPDYYVNISAVSARLSHPDNLLDCDHHEVSISSVARSVLKLNCSLLTESRRY